MHQSRGVRRLGICLRILVEITKCTFDQYRAAGRLSLATEGAKKCGLAGAIAPDETDLVAVANGERSRRQRRLASDLYAEPADLQHLYIMEQFDRLALTRR